LGRDTKANSASMDPTVKRLASGQASQSWMVSQCQKQDTKQRKEAVAEKVNKPNNKQNPQAQNRHCEKGQLRNVMAYASRSRQYGVKH